MVRWLILALVLIPNVSSAATIGLDTVLGVNTIPLLSGNPPYDEVFNYFFTLITVMGLISIFFKSLIRIFKKGY